MGQKTKPSDNHTMTRREALRLGAAAGTILVCRPASIAEAFAPLTSVADLDHIMWGVSDLDEGIDYIKENTGVGAVIGGQHPNRGTRNALIALGERQYLEILAPDPAQPDLTEGRVAVLKGLARPRILTWAAGTQDIDTIEKRVRDAGFETEGIQDGSRRKPNGTLLQWRNLTILGHDNTVVPFVIQWSKSSAHPSTDSPVGCKLRSLKLEHPQPEKMNALLEAMGLEVRVASGSQPKIIAGIESPKGELELT